MQCACPDCGIVMGWREKGVFSECRCPECGYRCSACLGTKDVLTSEQLRAMADLWGIDGGDAEQPETRDERRKDWHGR